MERRSGAGPIDTRSQVAAFLRSRRARLRPADVGLPGTDRHRRVPGLRREEVALTAGVSVAYLTRLEQGQAGKVSPEVLDALARALRLSGAEHTHLAHLLNCRHRGGHAPPEAQHVRPALRGLLAAIEGVPAYVTGRRCDLLAWNRAASAVFGDWDGLPPRERNWARLVFLHPGHRALFTDPEAVAADAVGALRLDAGCYPDDPLLAALLDDLAAGSADFRRLWSGQDVRRQDHGARPVRHPEAGALDLSFETVRLPGDTEQFLTLYSAPPGSPAAAALRALEPRPARD
jgi:transcriptional regulator with XRE-family HTH domain